MITFPFLAFVTFAAARTALALTSTESEWPFATYTVTMIDDCDIETVTVVSANKPRPRITEFSLTTAKMLTGQAPFFTMPAPEELGVPMTTRKPTFGMPIPTLERPGVQTTPTMTSFLEKPSFQSTPMMTPTFEKPMPALERSGIPATTLKDPCFQTTVTLTMDHVPMMVATFQTTTVTVQGEPNVQTTSTTTTRTLDIPITPTMMTSFAMPMPVLEMPGMQTTMATLTLEKPSVQTISMTTPTLKEHASQTSPTTTTTTLKKPSVQTTPTVTLTFQKNERTMMIVTGIKSWKSPTQHLGLWQHFYKSLPCPLETYLRDSLRLGSFSNVQIKTYNNSSYSPQSFVSLVPVPLHAHQVPPLEVI